MIRLFYYSAVSALVVCLALPIQADYYDGLRAWESGNHSEAFKEWQAAANAGDSRSMLALGRLYELGQGAPQVYARAHMWFNLAASRGETEAITARDVIAAKMTPEQIAQAQEWASAWQPVDEMASVEKEQASPEPTQQAPTQQTKLSVPPREAIREAQQLLTALGYKPGPADGIWGRRTAQEYRAFLRDAGLEDREMLTIDALRSMRQIASRSGTQIDTNQAPALAPSQAPPSPKLPRGFLQSAVARGDFDAVTAALKAGVDTNARDKSGWTALMYAIDKGYTPLAEMLLDANADPDVRAPDGATTLIMAVAKKRSDLTKMLLDAGADPSFTGPKGQSALDISLKRNPDGAEALFMAVRHGKPEILQTVFKANVNLNTTDDRGWTALMHAVDLRNAPATKTLLEAGANPNLQSNDGTSALSIAIGNDHTEVVEILIEANARLFNEDSATNAKKGSELGSIKARATALNLAIAHRKTQLITQLLNSGVDINERDEFGWTPLMHVVKSGDVELADMFFRANADPNIQSNNGETAILIAVEEGINEAIIASLINAGADPFLKSSQGKTAAEIVNQNNRNSWLAIALNNGIHAGSGNYSGQVERDLLQCGEFSLPGEKYNATLQHYSGSHSSRSGTVQFVTKLKPKLSTRRFWRTVSFEINDIDTLQVVTSYPGMHAFTYGVLVTSKDPTIHDETERVSKITKKSKKTSKVTNQAVIVACNQATAERTLDTLVQARLEQVR